MGGHGGLNILPQKRWNVYNFDNREKVRKDEEAAAKEEQLKREQARKRDAEFRLEKLRTAKGLEPLVRNAVEESQSGAAPPATEAAVAVEEPPSNSNHINLFEGIKIFEIVEKDKRKVELEDERCRKKRKEEPVRVVTAEDEKYRLGYGVAGKGVKLPWYMSKPNDSKHGQDSARDANKSTKQKDKSKSGGKKSLEELREERLAREKREKGRERTLLAQRSGRDQPVPEDRYYRR
uniref:CBF1-interacting co-repressor CIR N-terminal domain-containing protein n=1 Tax=Kalanchoe fedtschenkoi TaxID=63787 RepID=A0A7N0U009_KALFE